MPDDCDWDEHASWVALLDDGDDTSPINGTALVDRLVPAFAAHRHHGKEHMRYAFIPVVQHTKQLHDAIHTDIFPRRIHALASLDNLYHRFENLACRDMNAARAVYDDTKRSLDDLFSTLDDLDRQGDLLVQTLKAGMNEHVQRLRCCTDQIPVDAERLIASLDKKAKHLGVNDHARAKENLLRGILEKY